MKTIIEQDNVDAAVVVTDENTGTPYIKFYMSGRENPIFIHETDENYAFYLKELTK